MDKDNHIKECMELYKRINRASQEFPNKKFEESEVQLRYDAIKGILLMASSDAFGMYKEWNAEILVGKKEPHD